MRIAGSDIADLRFGDILFGGEHRHERAFAVGEIVGGGEHHIFYAAFITRNFNRQTHHRQSHGIEFNFGLVREQDLIAA